MNEEIIGVENVCSIANEIHAAKFRVYGFFNGFEKKEDGRVESKIGFFWRKMAFVSQDDYSSIFVARLWMLVRFKEHCAHCRNRWVELDDLE